MSDLAALERRYRRMLIWFPAGHRRVYGEEMIGVLLASTPDGQDRPGQAAALDLIGGGLRSRLRQSRTGEGNPAWRDALAVFSVVAPIVLLGWLTAGYLAEIGWQSQSPRFRLGTQLAATFDLALLTLLIATALVVAALAICPALTRRGRTVAATVVAVIAAAAAVIGLIRVYRQFDGLDEFALYLSVTTVMEVLALVASPGPARGWQLLRRRGLIVLAAISVVAIVGSAVSATGYQTWNNVNTISDLFGIVTVLGVALTLRRPVGGRLMALWAVPGYQFLGYAVAEHLFTQLQSSYIAFDIEFRLLPTAIVAALVGLAIWQSSRRTKPPGLSSG